MNMEGINNTSVVDNTDSFYNVAKKTSASQGKKLLEKTEGQEYNCEKDKYLLYCRDLKLAERRTCMREYTQNQISADDLRNCFKDAIDTAYDELSQSCYLKEGDQIPFLNKLFVEMKIEINQITEGANLVEGWNMAKSNGISESNCIYYNADYYYSYEEMCEMLRDCFDEFAEEKGIGDLKNEVFFARVLPPNSGFNNAWNCRYKNLKMINTEADPPRNFVFFYGANMETSEEILYVNGEGISSGQGQTLDLTAGKEEQKQYLTFLDFAKSRYQAQEELWERLHFLKNFRIYSLKRLLLNY